MLNSYIVNIMNELQEKEQLYLKAKEAYYNDEPIMEDSAFDLLEEWLKAHSSSVIMNVGAWDRKAKFQHPTKMGSLEKIQADKTTGDAPSNEFKKWFSNITLLCHNITIPLEITQKLDGNAINLIYENGKLSKALSRGDGVYGRDYLSKIDITQIPNIIPYDGIVEVRCEAVIRKDTFETKYSYLPGLTDEENRKTGRFKNERNGVAGLLNSDNTTEEQVKDIHLIPVEMHRVYDSKIEYHDISNIETWGFSYFHELKTNNILYSGEEVDFKQWFEEYKNFKYNVSPYRLDGFVIKVSSEYREIIGETDHHPKWALAVKFKPENSSTTVKGLEIKMGKTGNFTPVVILDPVDLDGSMVSRASGYNYKYIIDNCIGVGAIVTLVKSGDIIPQIVSVDAPASKPFDMPVYCPHCDSKLDIINETHLHCSNDNCQGKRLFKFIESMNVLDMDGVGDAFLEELYSKVCTHLNAVDYLCDIDMNSDKLVQFGMKSGKILDNFIEKLSIIKKLTLEQVIALHTFDGMSSNGKTVKEVAKKIAGIPYSFAGLEKKVVDGFGEGECKYMLIIDTINKLQTVGITIEFPVVKQNTIKICMTGSPKNFGFGSKNDFVQFLNSISINIEEVSVKDCEFLITDDLTSKSSKMKTAEKLEKKIVTYDYFK